MIAYLIARTLRIPFPHPGEDIAPGTFADTPLLITGFGLDLHGNLIVIDHLTGFYRLVPNAARTTSAPPFPRRLSGSGLYTSVRDRTLAPGLIAYSVNSPLWSDGAVKERAFAVPTAQKIGFMAGGQGWNFPDGTVVVKTFSLDTSPVTLHCASPSRPGS